MRTALLSLALLLPTAASAQESMVDDETIYPSLGLPQTWKPQAGLSLYWDPVKGDDHFGGEAQIGVLRDLINPVIGIGVLAEGFYRAASGVRPDGGARIMFPIRYIAFQFGWQYGFRDGEIRNVLGLALPLRRGGPLHKGGYLRLDWIRGPNAFTFGLTLPIGQPNLGRTRPRTTTAALPKVRRSPPSPVAARRAAIDEVLAEVDLAATWIDRFAIPYIDQRSPSAFAKALDALEGHIEATHPRGHSFDATVKTYHGAIERAFAIALGADDGGAASRAAAARARQLLLDAVLLPYNRLLGQRKKRDSLLALGAGATRAFVAWAETAPEIAAERRADAAHVFRGLVEVAERGRKRARKLWGDSRLVWIPLHYALRAEDRRSQEQLNAILARATGEEFTDANDVHYVVNEMFQREHARLVLEAEDYHVLWVHDYKGRNYAGDPDDVAFRQTVRVYLAALTARVEAFDETGKLPYYLIFIDQFFTHQWGGQRWLRLLQDPLHHRVKLPKGFAEMEEEIRAAQERLRTAVAGSQSLQEGRARHGERWLENRVKVHVSMTNPADPSFTGAHMIRFFPFLPDNIMRDHRKISFNDATERDPGRGEALYGGMGIGEHYAGPTWDDRAILVRGPVLASLKGQARALLRSQGFDEHEIPPPLRPEPRPADYAEQLAKLRRDGWDASVIEAHNLVGYGDKTANVARATLYDVMPAGAHIYVPDSLWNSPQWAGMLVGAALRGCQVAVIAPSVDNIPVSGGMMNARTNEVFARLVLVRDRLAEEIEAAGGFLAVGVYDTDVDVGDVRGKLEAMRDGVARSAEFRRIFPFDEAVYDTLARAPDVLDEIGYEASYLVDDASKRKPKLHLKTQFFASGSAMAKLLPLPEWEPLIRAYLRARVDQTTRRLEGADATDLRAAISGAGEELAAAFFARLTPEERQEVFFFLTVGSHNEDYRGMIMDGEVSVVVAWTDAMIAFLDFIDIISLTTWVEDVDELETMLPRHGWFTREFARFIKYVL